jgi:hypothetical protein
MLTVGDPEDACSKAHNRETGQGVQVVKSPPSSHFIRAAAGIQAGSAQSTGPPVGSISLKHLYEIAKVRMFLLSCGSLDRIGIVSHVQIVRPLFSNTVIV